MVRGGIHHFLGRQKGSPRKREAKSQKEKDRKSISVSVAETKATEGDEIRQHIDFLQKKRAGGRGGGKRDARFRSRA